MKDDYIKTNITLRKVDSETKNLIKKISNLVYIQMRTAKI
jgi:hypothetical protein